LDYYMETKSVVVATEWWFSMRTSDFQKLSDEQ
jgi:hypothetical protein